VLAEHFRIEYKNHRPYSALGRLSLAKFFNRRAENQAERLLEVGS
jgi:hypothetical protein